MSSACSTASWQWRGFEMSSGDSKRHAAERALEHQLSSGNLQLRSIDAEWLDQHKDLLDIFIENPNDPAVLEQIPHTSEPMDLCPASSPAAAQALPPGRAVQSRTGSDFSLGAPQGSGLSLGAPQSSGLSLGAPQGSGLARLATSSRSPRGHVITTGFGDSSPAVDTPQKHNTAGLRVLQPSRSDPVMASLAVATRGSATLDARASGLVPEVSLAARAGSLGATSMQSSHRNSAGARKAVSEGRTTSESDELVQAEAGEEPAPRKGPGRKKRTAPMLIETEQGETKFVSPAEFRKLRRRITNRMSARRMRKKHADERMCSMEATSKLEEELLHFQREYGQKCAQYSQLESRYMALAEENRVLKTRFGNPMGPPGALVRQQNQMRAGQPSSRPEAFPALPPLGLDVPPSSLGELPPSSLGSLSLLPQPPGLQHAFMGSFSFNDFSGPADTDFARDMDGEPFARGGHLAIPQMPQIPAGATTMAMAFPQQTVGLRTPPQPLSAGHVILPGRPI